MNKVENLILNGAYKGDNTLPELHISIRRASARRNASYVNLGIHANFHNISCVHACTVACSVHAQLELIDGCNKDF